MSVWKTIRRNPFQNLASITLLYFCLLMTGILLIGAVFIGSLLNYIESKPQVSVFFNPKTPQSSIEEVKNTLLATKKVASVQFISKEQALEIYARNVEQDPLLLEIVKSADILPPSLEVFATKPEHLKEIAELAKNAPGVEKVQFQKEIADKLFATTRTIRTVGVVFFIFLTVMTVLILTVLTSFKVVYRRDEIRIKLLLGADRAFIRRPFLQESFVLATLATGGAVATIGSLLAFGYQTVLQYLKDIPRLTLPVFNYETQVWPLDLSLILILIATLYCFALLITSLAAIMAVSKYAHRHEYS